MTTRLDNVVDHNALLSLIFDRARNRQLALTELFQTAEGLAGAGLTQQAAELYKTWIAFNADHPHLHLASFNFSVALRQCGDLAGAINALRLCVKQDPMFGPAHINLGRALEDCGLIDAAVRQWQEFIDGVSGISADRVAHKLMALQHVGRVCENADRLEQAEESLWQAIELRPDKFEAGQHWIALRQRQCKWPVLAESEHVSARQLLDAMSPMSLACYSDDPMFQLAKAYRYCKTFVGRPDVSGFARNPVRKKTGTGKRLRVGYVSSDLREHAVGFALSEVLEWRDASRIEIFAYYIGDKRETDQTQARIKASVDRWTDLAGFSDPQAARIIANDEIDILVDVNGYTKHARTRIFAYRPAPVIVNWCGYPGTMGSPWHQYMIADAQIVPPENEIFYSEKVLRIACNQPIDRKRIIDGSTPGRAEAGLPENAFVYASLNGMQKITANCFARWMTILAEVPDSVLWLLSGTEDTHARLRAAAAQSGIDPERLIFAPKAANPQHLARIALADLFLDTSPYGAHSTAADALTMGVPVLTIAGRSFAARFCGSVVASAGLRDLVCATPEDYVRRAIAFGRDLDLVRATKDLLENSRQTCALRDIPALARRLEQLFWQMQAECERGETPVPDLTNLDIYFEIGAELDQANIEMLDDHAYRDLYRDRLEHWRALAPVAPDRRFSPPTRGDESPVSLAS